MLSPLILTAKDDELLGTANRSDAMGVLAVWSARARDLVPHLTEQTTEARGFQILVEAFRLWEVYEPSHPEHAGRLSDFFILVEQAFARIVGHFDHAWPLPGSRRVKARLPEDPHISVDDNDHWNLLGGQKANGIWGLYRGAARRAGLLDETMTQLSSATRQAAYAAPCLDTKAQQRFFALAKQAMDGETVLLPTHGKNQLVIDICDAFDGLPLAKHLYEKLVDTAPLNRALAERLVQLEELDHRKFMRGASKELTEHRTHLEHAKHCEDLLAVVEAVFEWLCASKGETLQEASAELPVDLSALEAARAAFADSGHYVGATAQARQERFSRLLDTESHLGLVRSVLILHEKVSKPESPRSTARVLCVERTVSHRLNPGQHPPTPTALPSPPWSSPSDPTSPPAPTPSPPPRVASLATSPAGVLDLLETTLGLRAPLPSETERITALLPTLRTTHGYWSRSLTADEWGTARRLLRDLAALTLEGWAGQSISPRWDALWQVTRGTGPTEGERWQAVATALTDRPSTPLRTLNLLDPLPTWPGSIRRAFERLAATGTNLRDWTPPPLEHPGDLAAVHQDRFEPTGDASLQLIRAPGPLEGADDLAAWLHANTPEATTIIGADATLDEALRRHADTRSWRGALLARMRRWRCRSGAGRPTESCRAGNSMRGFPGGR